MSINKKQKELIKVFIFLFVLSFILVNWNEVSWIFNYRQISGITRDFFYPYEETAAPLIYQNNKPDIIFAYSDKKNSIEIPAINIQAPIVIGENTDLKTLSKNLDNGAVYYPGSVLPGQEGQIVILGHSAPPGWPKIKYDWIFSQIGDLNFGDEIILHFNNAQYKYIVKDKQIVRPGQDISQISLLKDQNILTLISCWPPGKDYQRIIVTAELQKTI